jgi:membrane protease subunit HflK
VIRSTARATARAEVARTPSGQLQTQSGPIQEEIRLQLQRQLDAYGAGVRIDSVNLQDVDPPEPVREAFADVTSAEQDRERAVLEAQGYADKVVPEARGRAEEALTQARAYRERRLLESEGEAARFTALLAETGARLRSRERLYLETMGRSRPRWRR